MVEIVVNPPDLETIVEYSCGGDGASSSSVVDSQLNAKAVVRFQSPRTQESPTRGGFFFGLITLAYSLSRLWRRKFCLFFPVRRPRAVAARCKLPFAVRPGLSREDEGNHKGNEKSERE